MSENANSTIPLVVSPVKVPTQADIERWKDLAHLRLYCSATVDQIVYRIGRNEGEWPIGINFHNTH